MFNSERERSDLLVEGSGLTLGTLELDSAMGVGSRIDPSKEAEDEVEYKQLKELVDEPLPSGSKGESCTPIPKVGMRSGAKKGSKSRINDSRVYSYDELIEYRPRERTPMMIVSSLV